MSYPMAANTVATNTEMRIEEKRTAKGSRRWVVTRMCGAEALATGDAWEWSWVDPCSSLATLFRFRWSAIRAMRKMEHVTISSLNKYQRSRYRF